MGIIDNLKEGVKSSKEKAVLGALAPAMTMIDGWTKDIKPQNDIAKFMEDNLGILFESKDSGDFNGITKLLGKMAVAEANESPDFVENKVLKFYESFRLYYSAKIKSIEGKREYVINTEQ